MNKMTGAELIVRLLERQGVRIISGIPGGANLPLYDALSKSSLIQHVLARHEQGAGFIAQGMARATGETAVCFATSGPGATNVLTAIADAKLDSIPVVCITGQVPLGLIGTDAFQEVDTYGMSIPITKHNLLVRSARELLEAIPNAFRIAASGRPGPVLVDVPKDVQLQSVEFDAWPEPGRAEARCEPDAASIARAVEMIDRAKRPVLYVGGGVIHAGAADVVRQLAEKAGLPVTMTLMALGAMPEGHRLSLGMLGMHAARYTNLVLEECDLLIAAGARFDDRATGKVAQFCPHAGIVHIDIDASELGKIKAPHVGISADVKCALEALCAGVTSRERGDWLSDVAALRRRYPMQMPGVDDPRTPYGLIRAVASMAGDDAMVSTDVGQHQMWVAQAYPFTYARQWLTSGGLGTMGFGLPAAIGAALARPGRTVVCFSGDGSLMMNIQELVTAAELGVNVKVVVLDNGSLGLVRQQQTLFYGKRLYASEFASRVDFCGVARAMGVPAYDLSDDPDPRGTLARALGEPGPSLVCATIHEEEMVYPMVPPGAANKEMIGGERHVNATI